MNRDEHRARAAAALRRFLDKPTKPRPGYSRALLKTRTPAEAVEQIMSDALLPLPSDLVKKLLKKGELQ